MRRWKLHGTELANAQKDLENVLAVPLTQAIAFNQTNTAWENIMQAIHNDSCIWLGENMENNFKPITKLSTDCLYNTYCRMEGSQSLPAAKRV